MTVNTETIIELANLAGIKILEDELEEVSSRFGSLMQEMERLKDIDLSDIHPVTIFPEHGEV